MSLSSTDSNNNGFNINEDVRENFWNAIWTLIHIKTNPDFDPNTYARVIIAKSMLQKRMTIIKK